MVSKMTLLISCNDVAYTDNSNTILSFCWIQHRYFFDLGTVKDNHPFKTGIWVSDGLASTPSGDLGIHEVSSLY